MSTREALIIGEVQYREGDGPNLTIRPGPVSVTLTAADATLGWRDGDSRGSTSMPLADFERYLNEQALRWVGPPTGTGTGTGTDEAGESPPPAKRPAP